MRARATSRPAVLQELRLQLWCFIQLLNSWWAGAETPRSCYQIQSSCEACSLHAAETSAEAHETAAPPSSVLHSDFMAAAGGWMTPCQLTHRSIFVQFNPPML